MDKVDFGFRSKEASRRGFLGGSASAALAGIAGLRHTRAWAQDAKSRINLINSSSTIAQHQLVVLKELKLFEKYGVEPNILNVADANKILAGLIGGDGDICPGSGFSGLFPAIEKGATVKILAATIVAPTNVIYSGRPDIKSVKDLVGRTVGTGAPGALLHQLVVAVMNKYGVDYTKVNFVNIGSSNDVFKALVAGSIDAGVGPIEVRQTAGKYNIRIIDGGLIYQELPLYTNQAMYASDKAIAEKRRGLVGVIAAYTEMNRWMANPQNKDAFLAYYRQALPSSSPEDGALLQEFFSGPGHLATDPVLSDQQINYVQQLNVELGVQKVALPVSQCADMSLAQEAAKLIKA